MKKHFFLLSLLISLTLGIGQMWGAEQTVSWSASTGALGTAISSEGGTATGTISTGTFSWNYTRTLATLKSGKSDYVAMSGSYMQLGSSNAGEDVEFRTSNIPGTIKSVTVLAGSKDSRHTGTITVGGTDYKAGAISAWASNAGADWTGTGTSSGEIVISISCNGKKSPIYIASITVVYEESGTTPTCATPTFTPAAGAVVSGTTVALASTTDGATIHYTTNGSEPTTSSATYSTPISITTATTIKAIAVKSGMNNSSVASASYTALTPLTTMDQIFAAATSAGSTATTTAITFNNWVVTGVKSSNAYVTDGTKGFIIYTSSHGFKVGDIISGTAICKVQLYNGSAELTELTASKVTVNTGGSVTPVVLDADGIAALSGVNTGSVIKISGECTSASSKYYIAGVQLYNTLYSFSVTAGTNYECTGVYLQYNSTKEMLPRSADDIVAQTSIANPTFSVSAGTYTEVQSVTLSCTTNGASIYYTTDGTTPSNTSTQYTSAIEVGASMTIKAIAYKGEDHSEVVSAAYTINLPLPSHDFQVTHNFSTDEGFEFPDGWGGSYAEHEIAYTDDKVHFVSASHQTGTITDRPIVKEGAISLILTNSRKLISAARFDYLQWSTKVPTLTMKYSTDGGATYNNFDPVVSTTDFALQVLVMPEGVNAIQVVGTADKQVGLTSIAFDLVDKPIVTKTVTITTPSNGTLVVKNGDNAIASGDAIEVGTTLTIVATPATDYKLDAISVKDADNADVTVSDNQFVVPNKNVTVSATFVEDVRPDAVLTLSEIGETHDITGNKQNDVIKLPTTATECNKTFVGWDANANCATAPTYAPGADYTLASTAQTLYAVYADPVAGNTWDVATSVKAGDVVVISTNTGYTANDMKTAGAISSSIFGCTASTYNADNSQITALAEGTMQFTIGGNATNGWTLKSGDKFLKVTAAKKVALVDDAETWNISFNGNNATLVPVTGDYTAYSIQYNYNSGTDRFTAYNSSMVAISLYKQAVSYENYSTECQAAVDPTSSNIVILAEYNSKFYALTNSISNKTAAAVIVEKDGDKIVVPSAEYKTAIQWKKTTSDENTTFQDADDKYLKGASNGGDLTLADAACNWSWNATDEYYYIGSRSFIYRESVNGFKNYATSNAGTSDYSSIAEVIEINPDNIVVTSKVNPQLAYSPASDEITVGDAWTTPSLGYVEGFDGLALITYESSDEAVATVSDAGVIALAGATGTAVITASFAGNTNYLAGVATYTIKVNAPGDDLSGTWALVTDAEQLAAGKKVVIAYCDLEGNYIIAKTMGAQNTNNRAAVASSTKTASDYTTIVPASGTKVFTLVDAGDGKFALQASNGKYLTSATSGTGNNLLEAADYELDNAKWSISISDEVASVVAAAGNKTVMQYNSSSTIFSCYGTANQKRIRIYMLQEETPEPETYAVIYELNGGQGTAPTQDAVEEGTVITLADATGITAPENQEFDGWLCDIDNEKYSAGDEYTMTAVATTFTAQWKAVTPDPEPIYTVVRSGLEIGRYYTICLPQEITAVRGAIFWSMAKRNSEGTLAYLEEVVDQFGAGKPYIYLATADKLEVAYGTDEADAPVANGALRGTFAEMNQAAIDDISAANENSLIYMLVSNQLRQIVGRTGNKIAANRAYVVYKALTTGEPNPAPGRRVATMSMQENVATGIDAMNADGTDAMKVIVNGQLFILRDGKTFDVTGREIIRK